MKEEVIKVDRMGITEPSTSDYTSPSVIVRKQDGSHRYCIDFRRINMVSLTDAEPMPNQEIVIGKLGASGYFTKIDLSKGYWQIPIKKEHRYLTAFQTEYGIATIPGYAVWIEQVWRSILQNGKRAFARITECRELH